jgi:hypothetical protein
MAWHTIEGGLPFLCLISSVEAAFLWGCLPREATLEKTHDDLVFRPVQRTTTSTHIYRVIEIELGFAYDYFFTNSPFVGDLQVAISIGKVVMYFIMIALKFFTIIERGTVTVVFLLVLLALELLQLLYIYLSSDHLRVVLAIISTKHFIYSQFYRIWTKLPKLFGYWQNKIGQQSTRC